MAYSFLHRYCRSQTPATNSQSYKLLMRVIYDGQASSLAKMVAHCEEAATTSHEHRRVAVRRRNDDLGEEEEEEEEAEDDDLYNEEQSRLGIPKPSHAALGALQVNVPHRSQLPSRSAVHRLNVLANRQGGNRFVSKARRASTIPLWSSDSELEDSEVVNNKSQLCGPRAVRPLREFENYVADSEDVAPSIEEDTGVDSFTAQLLRSAYGPSPVAE